MHGLCVFLCLMLSFIHQVFSQDRFNHSFFYFPKNIHVYVPSSACLNSKVQTGTTYNSYMGDLSLIRVYYADLNFSLERKDAGQYKKHIIGLGIYNNREGDYLNKFRVMGRYALHIPLKKDLTLAAGASV